MGKKKKKPESAFKTWLIGALTDLFIGIALIAIQYFFFR